MVLGRGENVLLDGQVVGDEVRGVGVVRVDAAHLGGREEDVLGAFRFEEGPGRRLVPQVQLGAGLEDQVLEALGPELADDGRADEAAVACDVDPSGLIHGSRRPRSPPWRPDRPAGRP
ncbi:hypothetical protein D3C86_1933530 [compost metagenome]